MSTAYTMQTAPKALFDYDKYWASCFEPAPFLPMSREEMDQLGWDACDFILVCGDAYIDHPSFVSGVIDGYWKRKVSVSVLLHSQTGPMLKVSVYWVSQRLLGE